VFGLLLHANHLRGKNKELNVELSITNDALVQVIARNKKLFLESMGPKPTPPPCPEPQDQFLELADLRRQLDEANATASRMNEVADKALGDLVSERRSNAALRGQITKLTPKKKVK
jgi:hypothetical protein